MMTKSKQNEQSINKAFPVNQQKIQNENRFIGTDNRSKLQGRMLSPVV